MPDANKTEGREIPMTYYVLVVSKSSPEVFVRVIHKDGEYSTTLNIHDAISFNTEGLALSYASSINECVGVSLTRWVAVRKVEPEAGITATLAERGRRYGDFEDNAKVSRHLKSVIDFYSKSNLKLNDTHKEALDMIAQKIARILNGDPNYKDNWHDIAGYAKLAEDRCVEDKG